MTDLIYELTPSVAEALSACADGGLGYTFAVLEPREDDSFERKRALASESAEIQDLINLDLLEDVSPRFHHQIENCRNNHGFGYKVVQLSPIAVMLFQETKHRRIN